jgi:cyclopropane-fatty-acyl-phospholipid synthase
VPCSERWHDNVDAANLTPGRIELSCAWKDADGVRHREFVRPRPFGFDVVRTLLRRIVDSVAEGGRCHLKLDFSDQSTHHSARRGDPDVTIIFRKRSAEWRMAFGGVFEFLESYCDGDVDIVDAHGLRPLVHLGFPKPFGRFEHPPTFLKRRWLEWQQNNRDLERAKRNATVHYGLPTEFFHFLLGDTYGYSEGLWKDDTRTLDKAQHNNFDLICQKLQLPGTS